MRWCFAPACFWLGVCAAQSSYDLAPELLTLAKIKVHMQETLKRQPNYTCTEQIERSMRRAPRGSYELLDMVQLEVALVDGKELFAWPGSRKFEEHELSNLVQGGAIGNGSFALFTQMVFASHAPIFHYVGSVDFDGKPALRYDYSVSELTSGHQIHSNNARAIVGCHGSFWVDPGTLDVLRLAVIADDIPAALALKRSATTMDFARIKVGEGDFLLPSGSELLMTSTNGDETRNRTSFRSCRQYTGDSVITFSEHPIDTSAFSAAAANPPPALESVRAPAGLWLEVALEQTIDGASAMVGDQIKATLRQPVKQGKEVLFPKGATLSGRILNLRNRDDHWMLDLEFFEIDSDSGHGYLRASARELLMLPDRATPNRQTSAVTVYPDEKDVLTIKQVKLHLARGARLRVLTR